MVDPLTQPLRVTLVQCTPMEIPSPDPTKNVAKIAEKTVEKTVTKPVTKPVEKTVEKTVAKPVEKNLSRLCQIVSHIAHDSDVIVFPEMFLSGYNIGSAALAHCAEVYDGPAATMISTCARNYNVAIAYGYPEKTADGSIYNSAQIFDAHGNSVLRYRKTHLYGDLDRACFSASYEPPGTCQIQGWNVGLLICYDVEFPELVRVLALANADLIIVPTANMIPYHVVPHKLLPARAIENQLYIGYANYIGTENDLSYCGCRCIVGPDGNFLAYADDNPPASVPHGPSRSHDAHIVAENTGLLVDQQSPITIISASLSAQLLCDSRNNYPYLQDRVPILYRSLS